MIEPDFDTDGRLIGLSLVAPLSEPERLALQLAMASWPAKWKEAPILPHDDDVRVIALCDHVWVPHPSNRRYTCVFCGAWQTV